MRKLLLLLFLSSVLFTCTKVEENKNSQYLMNATLWFQQSAEMKACYLQTYQLAELRLAQYLTEYNGDKKPAVVLDIDETVLDNSPFEVHLLQTGELYSSALWAQWTDLAEAKALPGAVEFTQKAKALGAEVIYISNRKTTELSNTLKNLSETGFPNADSTFVFLRTTTSDKTERRALVSEKYEILLFVGDNLTDFSNIFANRGDDLGQTILDSTSNLIGTKYIILLNPMYGEWEGAIYKNDYSKSETEKQQLRNAVLKGF